MGRNNSRISRQNRSSGLDHGRKLGRRPTIRPLRSIRFRRIDPSGDKAGRAMREYLATLDDAAFWPASEVTPKFVSPSDPAQWTGAMRGPAFFAYADNYLIDVKFGIILDVKATRAIRQAEVGAAKTMIERTEERFDIIPAYLAADTAYGSADTLNWIVNKKKIAPHIPVIDKSKREDGTFSREDFRFDEERNVYLPSWQSADHHRSYRPRSRAPLPGVTA